MESNKIKSDKKKIPTVVWDMDEVLVYLDEKNNIVYRNDFLIDTILNLKLNGIDNVLFTAGGNFHVHDMFHSTSFMFLFDHFLDGNDSDHCKRETNFYKHEDFVKQNVPVPEGKERIFILIDDQQANCEGFKNYIHVKKFPTFIQPQEIIDKFKNIEKELNLFTI